MNLETWRMDIPNEVLRAAQLLDDFAKVNGMKEWCIGNVADRRLVYRLELELEMLRAVEGNKIASGNNPDKLTVSQVGEGWRLLDSDEIDFGAEFVIEDVERWEPGEGWKKSESGGYRCIHCEAEYRTKLTREQFAEKRAGK